MYTSIHVVEQVEEKNSYFKILIILFYYCKIKIWTAAIGVKRLAFNMGHLSDLIDLIRRKVTNSNTVLVLL
jgi:hypothetical protein